LNYTGDYTKADYIALINAIKKLPLPIRKAGKNVVRILTRFF
jgi:hypothetical protein